jgi:hypothetical protein
VSVSLVERPQAQAAASLGGASLEALVRACLAAPEDVGCVVCGGALAPAPQGLACGECGSVLARGSQPPRVVRPVQR